MLGFGCIRCILFIVQRGLPQYKAGFKPTCAVKGQKPEGTCDDHPLNGLTGGTAMNPSSKLFTTNLALLPLVIEQPKTREIVHHYPTLVT